MTTLDLPRKFLEKIVLASHVVSKEKFRYDLIHVHVVLSKEGAKIEATDGHCLVQFLMEDCPCHESEIEIFFNRDNIKDLKTALKEKYQMTFCLKHDEESKETIIVCSRMQIIVRNLDASFPDTNAVIPKKMPDAKLISFNAKLLKQIADSVSPNTDLVTLAFEDSLTPMRVIGEDQTAIGVLMPCKIENISAINETLKINERN